MLATGKYLITQAAAAAGAAAVTAGHRVLTSPVAGFGCRTFGATRFTGACPANIEFTEQWLIDVKELLNSCSTWLPWYISSLRSAPTAMYTGLDHYNRGSGIDAIVMTYTYESLAMAAYDNRVAISATSLALLTFVGIQSLKCMGRTCRYAWSEQSKVEGVHGGSSARQARRRKFSEHYAHSMENMRLIALMAVEEALSKYKTADTKA